MRGLVCRLLIMVAPLGGCAGTSGQSQSFFAQPGKFHFLRCQDIAQRQIAAAKREQELNSLIDRANQSSAGPVISAMVYGPELEQTRADARQLQETANEKNCDASFAPAKNAPAKDAPARDAPERAGRGLY
jgi:hypothetical protein